MSKVTTEDIKKIASLAKLNLSETELSKYEKEFNNILDYISQISEVDVCDIPEVHNLDEYKDTVEQEDEPVDLGISREEYLQNATEDRSKNGYIRTSKIVDKGD